VHGEGTASVDCPPCPPYHTTARTASTPGYCSIQRRGIAAYSCAALQHICARHCSTFVRGIAAHLCAALQHICARHCSTFVRGIAAHLCCAYAPGGPEFNDGHVPTAQLHGIPLLTWQCHRAVSRDSPAQFNCTPQFHPRPRRLHTPAAEPSASGS
jgi:hypothetical protein